MAVKIPLQNSDKYALVEPEDYPLIRDFKWYLFSTDGLSYAKTGCRVIDGQLKPLLSFTDVAEIRRSKVRQRFNNDKIYSGRMKNILLHRMITNPDKNEEVDHINGNGLDNRRVNLRLCSHQDNMRNRKMLVNNTSGYTGIFYRKDSKRKKRWGAHIRIGDGKRLALGTYYTKQEAAMAYNRAAIKYHGEFARLNPIED